jgi:hypothetical protein
MCGARAGVHWRAARGPGRLVAPAGSSCCMGTEHGRQMGRRADNWSVVRSEAAEAVRTLEQIGDDTWHCRMPVSATLGVATPVFGSCFCLV